jgi:hypothetical protein
VNGTNFTGSKTFNVAPGTILNVSAPSPQVSNGTQNLFDHWSDLGLPAHAITAPAQATTFTASFNTQFQLTEVLAGTGSGTLTPASGSFFDPNTPVTLTEKPAACSEFVSYSANAPAGVVNMTMPQSVTATFNNGTARDVTKQVVMTVTGNRRVTGTNRWRRTINISNPGAALAKVWLAFDAPMVNVVSVTNTVAKTTCSATAGSPYIKLLDIPAGTVSAVTLEVTTANPDALWSALLRVLSGDLP